MAEKPVTLILCTQNACRSQMAEAILRKLAGERMEVVSAGVDPADMINPLCRQVMEEAGYDMSSHTPKALSDFLGRLDVRHVLIVCDRAAQNCPAAWPNILHKYEWPFDDPSAIEGSDDEKLAKAREIRDAMTAKLEEWIATL